MRRKHGTALLTSQQKHHIHSVAHATAANSAQQFATVVLKGNQEKDGTACLSVFQNMLMIALAAHMQIVPQTLLSTSLGVHRQPLKLCAVPD
jgi:uncharacterized protein (DUF2141 family)